MSEAMREAVIEQHCRELKLPTVLREYPALARQGADGGWRHEEFLHQLLEAEVDQRRQHTIERRIREARFPEVKTLEQIQWQDMKGVSRKKVAELASCEYIERGEDLIIAGPLGTGKSHLAIALGVEAARRRYRVRFVRAADLVAELIEARDERSLSRLHRRYARVALLALDELGFVPFERAGGELLFNLLADRYEAKRPTLITTNLSFAEWPKVFGGDEKLATALLDRLAHRGTVLTTKGESYRTRRNRLVEDDGSQRSSRSQDQA